MDQHANPDWESRIVLPEQVIKKIKPGMRIFVGTGVAEPRTMVRHLMGSDAENLQDLEIVQLGGIGDTLSINKLEESRKCRLKTFFSGWVASEAISAGSVDLIPSMVSEIPMLFEAGLIDVDAACVQISPPDENGYCSLGVAVDVARLAIARASLVVGEIHEDVPRTSGDTFVHVSDFDCIIRSTDDFMFFDRWPVHEVFEKLAENIAVAINDGDCLAFSIGPLFEALGRQLARKRHLGIHTPFFTDALMDLVKSGAVTNRRKGSFVGKSLASHAVGTRELVRWLDRNPLVEFQGIDRVFNSLDIGRNPNFVFVLQVRKVDLIGRAVLHTGKNNVAVGPGEALDFMNGARLSPGGRIICALPSRNRGGDPNILPSAESFANTLPLRQTVDIVATEHGMTQLKGRTLRERTQKLIDLAHPDDRLRLFEQAKKMRLLYPDQILLKEFLRVSPDEKRTVHEFKDNLSVRFRLIRPSDEEEMRRLFYRFSEESVYYRYFTPIQTMPHRKMQQYVTIDYARTVSFVGWAGLQGSGHIIAEARFVQLLDRPLWADVAFVVDEAYQGRGIASFLFGLLAEEARKRHLRGFVADVLATNRRMMKVFEKCGYPVNAHLDSGVYALTIDFSGTPQTCGKSIRYL